MLSTCKRSKISDRGSAEQDHLLLTGSSTVAPLGLEIAKRFERLHPGVRIDVQAGGSSRGIADVRQRLAQIGMVSRVLKPDEADLRAFTVALDGVAIIVHRSNPIRTLSGAQVRDVYTGVIRSWKDLGGADRPITVVSKAEGRSTLELFTHHFGLTSAQIRAHVIIGDNEQGIKTVAGNVDAIGYVSIGTALYDAGKGVPVKALPLDGVEANLANVANRTFPLARPLNLVVSGEPGPLARSFLEFATSPAVNDLVLGQSFVLATAPVARE